MPTRFAALRNHRIHPALSQPLRFGHAGGAGNNACADVFQRLYLRGGRQAEMKAHHRRAVLLHDCQLCIAKRLSQPARIHCRRIHAETGKIRLQKIVPAPHLLRGGFKHLVGKEIHIKRRISSGLNRRQFSGQLRRRQ